MNHIAASYSRLLDLSSAADIFIDSCRFRNLSPNTIIFYRDRLKVFRGFCERASGSRDISAISTGVIRDFIVWLMEQGVSAKTINHNLQALRTFFNFLVDEGFLAHSPAERVRPQKVGKRMVRTLSREQISLILDTCDRSRFIGLRNYTIILILFDTGLRVSELASLLLSDIDWHSNLLRVVGKGDKERHVPLGATVRKALREYLMRRATVEQEEHLFLNQFGQPMNRHSIRKEVVKVAASAGIGGVRVTPHIFRHSFAKEWIISGGDPFSLQMILGHTTQQMVSRYVTLAKEDLKFQHRKHSPVDGMNLRVEKRRVLLR